MFLENHKDVDQSHEQGIEIDPIYTTINTTLFINDFGIITINDSNYEGKTTLVIDQDSYLIDLDYESFRYLLQEQLRAVEAPLTTK